MATVIKVDTDQLNNIKGSLQSALEAIQSDGEDDEFLTTPIGPVNLQSAADFFHTDSQNAFNSAKRDIESFTEAVGEIIKGFEETDDKLGEQVAEGGDQS